MIRITIPQLVDDVHKIESTLTFPFPVSGREGLVARSTHYGVEEDRECDPDSFEVFYKTLHRCSL